jgi:hypothetical protein
VNGRRRRTTEAQHACVTLKFGALLEHCFLCHTNMTWAGRLGRARHILRAPPLEPPTVCRAHCPRCLCVDHSILTFFVFDIMAGVAGVAGEGRGEGVVDSLSTVSVLPGRASETATVPP